MPSNAAEMLTIDRVADEFESEWRRGVRPPLAPYLDRVPAKLRAEVLSELVQVDLEYRRKRGDAPTFREYEEQFPGDFRTPNVPSAQGDRPTEIVTIGRYFVLSRLPSSGQGEVFLAMRPGPVPLMVILKFLRSDVDPRMEFMIDREARILAQIDHANIARVIEVDRHEGRAFVAVAYVAGQTLDQYVQPRALREREIALLVASISRTLAAAHDAGIAHLDLKPKNIVVDARGEPHVIDFGAAWASNTLHDDAADASFLAGTIAFTSPEQAREDLASVGIRSDIFGLGALLYWLLKDEAPFAAPDHATSRLLAQSCDYPPLGRTISRRLRNICEQAMAADPANRQRDARELAVQLERFARLGASRRRFVLVALGAAAAIGLGIYGRSLRAEAPGAPPDPELAARVWIANEWIDLKSAGRLKLGDSIAIQASAPVGCHASLWMLDGGRDLSPLTFLTADSPDRALNFPAVRERAKFEHHPGNWTLICLTSRAGPVDEPLIRYLLDGAPQAELLPAELLVEMTGRSVTSVRRGSLKPLSLTDDAGPDVPARAFLEHLRTKAAARGFGVRAIMFPVADR